MCKRVEFRRYSYVVCLRSFLWALNDGRPASLVDDSVLRPGVCFAVPSDHWWSGTCSGCVGSEPLSRGMDVSRPVACCFVGFGSYVVLSAYAPWVVRSPS